MILLIAGYLLIITILIALDLISVRSVIQNKRIWMAVLSSLTFGILLFVWKVQGNQTIAPFLVVPFVILGSSIYEIYRKGAAKEQYYYFHIPEQSYEAEKNPAFNLLPSSMLKNTNGIHWDGKLIIMPHTFSATGEALDLECIKPDKEKEIYYCSNLTILPNAPIGKRILSISLIMTILALPICFYLSKVSGVSAEYWSELATGLSGCVLFGFVKLMFYGSKANISMRLVRVVMNIFYVLSIIGVILTAVGVN